MRCFILTLTLLGAAVTATYAQDAIPNLKGTWSGKGKTIVFGNNRYHPGSQTTTSPPRIRDIESTHVVEGQDGRLFGAIRHPQPPTPRSRLPGRLQATTRRSSVPTWTAIFNYSYLARPHGEVLRPKRDKPKQIDHCHLSYDGSGKTVVIVARANGARRLVSIKSARRGGAGTSCHDVCGR